MIVDAWERAMELADVVGLDGVDTPIFDQLALEREGGSAPSKVVPNFADVSDFFGATSQVIAPEVSEVSWWGRVKGWFQR